jgi:hypothetical protein
MAALVHLVVLGKDALLAAVLVFQRLALAAILPNPILNWSIIVCSCA